MHLAPNRPGRPLLANACRAAPLTLLALGFTPAAFGQGQPAELFWADRWNAIYHRFVDADADGTYLGDGEVTNFIDPNSPASFPASSIDVRIEDGLLVAYWLLEFDDTIMRGVDTDRNGQLAGAEITVFRDSGALDGESWPQQLDVADDGGVWWTAALIIANPQNGLSRLEDLNGDGDASDAGEQVVMVDGNGRHDVVHDGGSSPILSAWSMANLASAGNGVMAFSSQDDMAAFRFEDINGDGDVRDTGESILLLNATGVHPTLPMNPDFADGTLRNLENQAGSHGRFTQLASAMVGGQRVYYFATAERAFSSFGTNVDGEGINFLIFRGIDGNGDGDVNDAGEVTLFFDGSTTTGDPRLLTLRGLDAVDGGLVYAAELKPFPVFGPGENGNIWIHRFQDINRDGDAHDPDEQQLGIFDLQIHGYDAEVFPTPPDFGNVMADPWDLSTFVPPAIAPPCPADTNGDGTVNVTDLVNVILDWDSDGSAHGGDVSGDGIVNVVDLVEVILAWGPCS